MAQTLNLTQDDRATLVRLGHRAVAAQAKGAPPPVTPQDSPGLELHAGVFVTLRRKDKSLRGCIGTFSATQPVHESVVAMAAAAASRDPRFTPVTPEEVDDLIMEISVLSPPEVATAESVKVGVHGLRVSNGANSGVLLPKVPEDQGWDRTAFLEGTCQKAGLNPDAWKDPATTIETFTACVFGDDVPADAD